MLASITIPIITVSFHFFPPPPPFPGKNSPREERERGPTYSWEYHDWVLTCSAFHVRKMVIFPFPPSESLHLKDPNIFPLSPSQLGWFFHGKWSWVSIFPLWGSGDRLQNENISLLCKHNTVNVWNEVSRANFVPHGQKNQIPGERLSPCEPARLNLVTIQSSGRAFWQPLTLC